MIYLKIYLNKVKQQEVLLKRQEETLGRSRTNTLCLGHDSVSSLHAVIRQSEKGVEIEDQESTNGLFVNEERVVRASLKVGDRIRLGQVGLIVDDIRLEEILKKGKRKNKKKTVKKKIKKPVENPILPLSVFQPVLKEVCQDSIFRCLLFEAC
jgi:pSer/pThr/pTyr-binding forkhead associated (FHA) protein